MLRTLASGYHSGDFGLGLSKCLPEVTCDYDLLYSSNINIFCYWQHLLFCWAAARWSVIIVWRRKQKPSVLRFELVVLTFEFYRQTISRQVKHKMALHCTANTAWSTVANGKSDFINESLAKGFNLTQLSNFKVLAPTTTEAWAGEAFPDPTDLIHRLSRAVLTSAARK